MELVRFYLEEKSSLTDTIKPLYNCDLRPVERDVRRRGGEMRKEEKEKS